MFYDDDTLILGDDEKKTISYNKTETEILQDALVNESTYSEFERKYLTNIKTKTFVILFRQYMLERNLDVSTMMRRTGFSKSYFYQLLNSERKPSRDSIINICFNLECDLEETNYFLKISEKQELYAKNKRDSIIIYSLVNGYTMKEANKLLEENDEQLLC